MANLNNTSLEQFGKTLENVLTRIHYSTWQTRNGSDLSANGVEYAIEEAKRKSDNDISKTIKELRSGLEEHAKTLRKINASTGNTYRQKEKNYREKLVNKYEKEQEEAALGAGMGKRAAKKYAKERAKEYQNS